jgi:hypothetical protein
MFDVREIKMTFAAAARPFVEHARIPASDVLPIIPPGASLLPQSKVKADFLGKTPGRFFPGRNAWAGLAGAWPTEGLPSELRASAASWPTSNVGLRAASWPGVDIDVGSDEARELIEDVAVTHLGSAPVRTRAGSPRVLLVYRATGDEPIRKMRLVFTLGGLGHAVEVLASGQQYLIAGTHPTGAEYGWRDGFDLTSWGVDGLGPISAADVRSFMQAATAAVITAGGKIISATTMRIAANGDGVAVLDAEPILDPDVALAALRAVPNTSENLPDRSDLVSMLAAFKAALGNRCEEWRSAAMEWAVAHDWCSEEYFAQIWDSLTHVRVGPDYLIRKARRMGWHGDAASDFDDLPPEEVEAQIAAAQEQTDEEQQRIETAARQVVYWPEQQIWVVTATGELLSLNAFNYHSIGMSIGPAGRSGINSSSARLRNSSLVRDVAGVTYMPGKPRVTEWARDGRVGLWFNRWQPSNVQLAGPVGDVSLWLKHLEWLLPEDAERNTLIEWMAYIIQNPGKKIRWAPVIIGAQGLGKDAALKPLIHAIGSHNMAEVSPAQLVDRWTSFYENQLVVVQEVNRLDKLDMYERIKAAITGTGNDTLMVERKYQPAYPVPNTVAFAFLTNHSDAFAIAPDDRRFFVVQCAPVERQSAAYYDELHNWYRNGGLLAVARYLSSVVLDDFRADTAPAWTDAKQMMLEETLPAFAQWLMDQIKTEGGRFHGRTLIAATEVRDIVSSDFSIPQRMRDAYSPKTTTIAMRALGWHRPSHQVRLRSGEKARVWVRDADALALSEKLIAQRLAGEQGAAPEFSVVG